MVVPPYCRSKTGRVFRVLRSSNMVGPDRMRFCLRAQDVNPVNSSAVVERAREVDAGLLRDKIARHHVIPTPESTFEDLWQQLRVDLDVPDSAWLS
jgi:hypothetical protein